jgi:hypothetical protein
LLKYPDLLLYIKDNKVIMEQDLKNNIMYCDNNKIWKYFETNFNLFYIEIRQVMKGILEEYFKLGELKPRNILLPTSILLEEHFKLGELTPFNLKKNIKV